MTDSARDGLLPIALSAAVPLWIEKLRPLAPEQRVARASGLADIIASQGDIILYRSSRKGESANAFNALAEGAGYRGIPVGRSYRVRAALVCQSCRV
jgi:hypothetical protein